jgi:protein-L-isoaspartate(D-aspartate) O-methyltransferase
MGAIQYLAMAGDFLSERFESMRRAMVASQLRARGIRDERVLSTMEKVPRHIFVASPLQKAAYDDNPVPLGEGQTISQPFIVGYMLEALQVQPEDRVLEVGTGTGYQAALLGELAREVYTIERVPALHVTARDNLEQLGYSNVETVLSDGTRGLPERAPFDRIIVAAAAPDIPGPLFEQLAEGGRMVIPVGTAETQDLLLVRKHNGLAITQRLEGCRFVPLVGEQGFRQE